MIESATSSGSSGDSLNLSVPSCEPSSSGLGTQDASMSDHLIIIARTKSGKVRYSELTCKGQTFPWVEFACKPRLPEEDVTTSSEGLTISAPRGLQSANDFIDHFRGQDLSNNPGKKMDEETGKRVWRAYRYWDEYSKEAPRCDTFTVCTGTDTEGHGLWSVIPSLTVRQGHSDVSKEPTIAGRADTFIATGMGSRDTLYGMLSIGGQRVEAMRFEWTPPEAYWPFGHQKYTITAPNRLHSRKALLCYVQGIGLPPQLITGTESCGDMK
jgi:hypothetical protein